MMWGDFNFLALKYRCTRKPCDLTLFSGVFMALDKINHNQLLDASAGKACSTISRKLIGLLLFQNLFTLMGNKHTYTVAKKMPSKCWVRKMSK